MKLKSYSKIAFKNLRRRKMRTFLTSFAVSIGTMLIILMVSIGVGVQKIAIDSIKANTSANTIMVSPRNVEEADKIIDMNKNDKKQKKKFVPIDKKALDKIKNISSVSEITVSSYANGTDIEFMGKALKNSFNIAYDLNYTIFTKDQIDSIRMRENKKDLKPIIYGNILTSKDKNSVLISENLLKKLGIKNAKDVIGKEITIKAKLLEAPGIPKIDPLIKKFKVIGLVREEFSDNANVIMSIEDAKDILDYTNMKKNYYAEKGPSQVQVIAKKLSDVSTISDEISKMEYQVTSIQSSIKDIKSGFIIIQAVLSVVGIIIIFVASIGVINTMTMSIYERTRSIGIMKALGCSRADIRKLFIVESATIGFIGGLMGLVFSIVNTGIIKVALTGFLKSKGIKNIPNIFVTPVWLVLGTIGFAILISIVAGLYPANKASKLDPIESLKYE
ncbi:FtsX-like permease family protein [Clostridium sp. Marseille-Q2269]|uniref:ABC transporter permease n=1 Tax=Clostridium sp. Marseille-Q2269 TaxID=2942205 RepID=UPI00207430F2|nr:FtsX-like permease family protein [Clostridium sp. Marseille-Q2269]